MAQKVFKNLDEQIELLLNKGLKINDIEYAKEILLRENYFFLMGYRHVFLKPDGRRNFIKGTTFDEIHSLFIFDRKFRNIIFKNLLIVENNYKSIFSYALSKKYGYKERDYLNPNNFDNTKNRTRQINDLLRKLKRQIRVNGSQHQATNHYISNYGYIPMWVGVKVLSFGIISEMFSILKQEDKKKITEIYNIEIDDFEIYLPILANYRNLCAHEDILFNHYTQRMIPDSKYHNLLNIDKTDGEYIYGKNDIFALIIILKYLLTKDDFKMMMNEIIYEIDILNSRIKSIEISKILDVMGFPKNFKEIMYFD